MPRYFFTAQNGRRYPDPVGVDLPGPAAARGYAVKALTELLSEMREEFLADESFILTVTDEAGLLLYRLDLSAVRSPTGA